MRYAQGWVGLFCLVISKGLFGALIPDSLKVMVIVTAGRFQDQNVVRLEGELFTRIEGRDREQIGGGPLRMQPYITYGRDQTLDWKWRDAAPLGVALDRLSHKDGTLLFEMEDGTWATGTPHGISVRDGVQQAMFLTVTVWDLVSGEGGVLQSKPRLMNIPLEDVADRVFRTPVLKEDFAREPGAEYFITNYDEALVPITILGIERVFAWVCLTKDLEKGGARGAEKFLVPLEVLRRVPKGALAQPFHRLAAKKTVARKDLAQFARAEMPACLLDLADRGLTAVKKAAN